MNDSTLGETLDMFGRKLKKEVQRGLGKAYETGLEEIEKNNRTVRTGLWVREETSGVAMIIYLEEYFQRYQDGESLETLALEIRKCCQENHPGEGLRKSLGDFEWVKGRLACGLVNARWNRESLEQVPHVKVMDLAVVFYVDLGETEEMYQTALISCGNMALWGTCMEELAAPAVRNTLSRHPAKVRSMVEMILGMEGTRIPGETVYGDTMDVSRESSPMYILDNGNGKYGAAAMLYPGVLAEVARQLGGDLMILPSSTCEVIVTRWQEEVNVDDVERIIRQINQKEVPAEQVLSEQVYVYRQSDGCLWLVKSSGEWEKGFFLDALCGDMKLEKAG